MVKIKNVQQRMVDNIIYMSYIEDKLLYWDEILMYLLNKKCI